MTTEDTHTITRIRSLTESTFALRLERKGLQFRAGQRLIAGLIGDLDQREYSIYSGENDDYIEILVREIPWGSVSIKLTNCKPGDILQINGPFGSLGIEPFDRFTKKFVFIATGTGISPFHSFIRSYPGIDYILIHGVQYGYEAYERDEYDPIRYILCTSREVTDGRKGRVTKFLSDYRISNEMLFYLCGNGNMIYDVNQLLRRRGIPAENIFQEIYF